MDKRSLSAAALIAAAVVPLSPEHVELTPPDGSAPVVLGPFPNPAVVREKEDALQAVAAGVRAERDQRKAA